MDLTSKSSSAEKRILWEVRKRYNIHPPATKVPLSSAPKRRISSAAVAVPTPPTPRPLARERHRSVVGPPAVPPTSAGGDDQMGRNSRRPPRKRRPKHWIRQMFIALIFFALVATGVFGYRILAVGNQITTAERSILGQLKDLLFNDGKQLQGEAAGRINIMLIAVGGEGHNGENLADTIMIASIDPATNQVALLSIPRDLYVQVPDEEYYSKINAVHAYGESRKQGEGPLVLKGLVETITGLPIHYYARVDFTGFKQIIDAVGGVTIEIATSFFDYWHKIDFRAGSEHMDGERALAYVRARYVEGPEGGDFKRAARQQQVLLALRDEIFSVDTALDFAALSNILDSVSNNVRTDMQLWEMKRFYELARQINHQHVGSVVLTTGPRGVLVGGTEVLGDTPASILKTRTGDFSEIQALAANLLTDTTTEVPVTPNATPKPTDSPTQTPAAKPTVEIRNGTNITGLASRTSAKLTDEGYEVSTIGNAATRDHTTSIVYALQDEVTDGAKAIADTLGATADFGLPAGEAASEAAVLIILGEDARE